MVNIIYFGISQNQKRLPFGQPFSKYLELRYNDLALGQIATQPDNQKVFYFIQLFVIRNLYLSLVPGYL